MFLSMDKKEVELYFDDAVMGRPYSFSIDGTALFLYPVTLGKMLFLQRKVESLGINKENLSLNISMEALRLVAEKKKDCVSFIAAHTCKNKRELFDYAFYSNREKFLLDNLSDEDAASLMMVLLGNDKTALFMEHYGIDKEQQRMSVIVRIKNKKGNNEITFGGKTVYGALIDEACERYGWTKDYVVWGIDYTSLRLMLADKVTSMYLSDEELKKVPSSMRHAEHDVIKATKNTMEEIKKMDWR